MWDGAEPEQKFHGGNERAHWRLEPYARLSLRVDDPAEPFAELRRRYGVARERFIPCSRAFPTPERPYGITGRAVIEKIIERDAGKPRALDAPIPEA